MNYSIMLWLLISSLTIAFLSPCDLSAEPMPKRDVVYVPETTTGLYVSNLFQTNMVLQRDKPIHIWGWAAPAEKVTVSFANNQTSAVASRVGAWKVTLPALPANSKPQELTIQGKNKKLTLENILVGDIWILGGQSNMEFELEKIENGQLEIVSANFPEIRILTVPQGVGPEPKKNFARLHEWSDWFGRHYRKGDWDICTPEIAQELSGIGYVFARRIHKASNIPIGVIDASRGGTTVEAWTPLDILRKLDSKTTKAKLKVFDDSVAEWDPKTDLEKRIKQHSQWVETQTKKGTKIPEDKKSPPEDLRPGPLKDPNYPGNSYAGMLAPLAGLSVKGAIFHQGYNNAFDGSVGAEMYQDIFPEMIKAWRNAFNDPQMAFGILSLCTEGYPQTRDNYCEMMYNGGIGIREAHFLTFLKLYNAGDKNIGYTSTYDLRRRWFHPQLKLPAGERIARWAIATQYGFDRQIEWKPPMLTGMEVIKGALLLKFDMDVGDPEDGNIEGFAIAAEDRKFHPADVKYAEKNIAANGKGDPDRKQLILSSPMVEKPVHFRYAWGRNPLANLQATGNKDIPFPTQRSDNWIMEETPSGILPAGVKLPLSNADENKIKVALREQDRLRRLKEAELIIKANGKLPTP